jgi:RimJ/RimL family protein N-acetyltransferase
MSVIIREANLDDAEQLIAHITAIANEPGSQILLWPGELRLTIEDERKWISGNLAAENSTLLVAESEGKIVGVLSCKGGEQKGTRHTTTLGISVHKDWRNQRVGRALMERATAWAKGTGVIKRIQLEVTAGNAPGIHLYEQLGFKKEGIRHRGMFKYGEYLDTWMMALLVELD